MNYKEYISPKSIVFALGILLVLVVSSGHIGSPSIIFSGNAGVYPITVNILPPDVVPGTAQISIRVKDKGISRVLIQAVYFRHGGESSPKPELIAQVPGDTELYSGLLWLMSHGSSSVKITVEGLKGSGSTVIPVQALATAQLKMENNLQVPLLILGLILFVGGVTIIAASIGEGVLKSGEKLNTRMKWRTGLTATFSFLLFAYLLYLANLWWLSEENRYKKRMYKPVAIETTLIQNDSIKQLNINLLDEGHIDRKAGDLVPDHGKLMHTFIISESDMNYFAHLHPLKLDFVHYKALLPNDLPAGNYRVFSDIVHESGLGETLVSKLTIPAKIQQAGINNSSKNTISIDKNLKFDADDSWYKHQSTNGLNKKLNDKSTITWERPANKKYKVGQIESLRFSVLDANGLPALLEPYLGMLGHAVIMREDASVFIHVHPIGTISMAAQEALAKKIADSITLCLPLKEIPDNQLDNDNLLDKSKLTTMRNDIQKMMKEKGLSNEVSFPYAFPKAGKYRIWVQVKLKGKIQTIAFDTEVY